MGIVKFIILDQIFTCIYKIFKRSYLTTKNKNKYFIVYKTYDKASNQGSVNYDLQSKSVWLTMCFLSNNN